MESIIKNIEYDYLATKKALEKLAAEYPFIHLSIAGQSALGRNIPYVKIGRENEYVLFAAAFHGSEHITTNILLMFLEQLCFAIKNDLSIEGLNVKRAMKGRALIIMPLINPDGVEISINGAASGGIFSKKIEKLSLGDTIHWNANARGVDINHNFDAGWQSLSRLEKKSGIYGPAPTRFGGFSPMSEPETLALSELCNTYIIRHAVAFHSQGEVIYWQFGENEIPRAQKMAEIMATSSGYALDVPLGLAVGGGFKDWFIKTFSRPAFTVEVGQGKNPLPTDMAVEIYLKIREMLMLSAIM